MNQIKGIFFDVDGTLICHERDQNIAGMTLRSLYRLKENGIFLFVATGRHPLELEELGVNFPFDGYIVLNGQLCLDAHKRVLSTQPLFQDDEHILKNFFQKKRFPLVFVEKERLYINYINDQVKMAQRAISTSLPKVSSFLQAPIYQATAFIDKKRSYQLAKILRHSKITRWNAYGIDIVSKQGGKVWGVQQMLKHFQIPQENTMAFGDGENDIEMLKFVQVGIAMGNAPDIVKQYADDVTRSSFEEGITQALFRYGLLVNKG